MTNEPKVRLGYSLFINQDKLQTGVHVRRLVYSLLQNKPKWHQWSKQSRSQMQAWRQGRQNLACEHFVTPDSSSPCTIHTVQPWVKHTASPGKCSSHWISELYSSWNRWTECKLNCDRWSPWRPKMHFQLIKQESYLNHPFNLRIRACI